MPRLQKCILNKELMTMDKEKYTTPETEIVEFKTDDIITTSLTYESDETPLG